MELDFLEKKNVGTNNVDGSSPTFTVQTDTLFKTLNSEIIITLKTIPCSAAHTCIGQLRECPP